MKLQHCTTKSTVQSRDISFNRQQINYIACNASHVQFLFTFCPQITPGICERWSVLPVPFLSPSSLFSPLRCFPALEVWAP